MALSSTQLQVAVRCPERASGCTVASRYLSAVCARHGSTFVRVLHVSPGEQPLLVARSRRPAASSERPLLDADGTLCNCHKGNIHTFK